MVLRPIIRIETNRQHYDSSINSDEGAKCEGEPGLKISP
jgi:hypothetical protein